MRLGNGMKVLLVALICAVAVGEAGAAPDGTLQNGIQNQLTQKRLGLDLRVIESRQKRRQFQQQQERYRQQDRLDIREQRLDLDVPAMRRNCQRQVRGNDYLGKGCR